MPIDDDNRTKNNAMRHEYRTLTDGEEIDMRAIKDAGLNFYEHVKTVESHYPQSSRELALAKTKIEEAVMWAVKHITG